VLTTLKQAKQYEKQINSTIPDRHRQTDKQLAGEAQTLSQNSTFTVCVCCHNWH